MNLDRVPVRWWGLYKVISKDLGIDMDCDRLSTRVLSDMLERRSTRSRDFVEEAQKLVRGRTVVVFGAGPSVRVDMQRLLDSGKMGEVVLAAADGAARCMEEFGVKPSILVTDLDGCATCINKVTDQGGIAFVHAHGDNIALIREWVPNLRGAVVGTTQVEPLRDVFNFGGFTDGDRAVHIAVSMDASRVVLAGMDFGTRVSKYSKPWLKRSVEASDIKRRKLGWGKILLEKLAQDSRVELYNATTRGEDIKGYRRIEFSDML